LLISFTFESLLRQPHLRDSSKEPGGLGGYYELPFKALKYLLDEGIYTRAARMKDPRVMPREERAALIRILSDIDPRIARDIERKSSSITMRLQSIICRPFAMQNLRESLKRG
jgi:hypothetical protein